MGHSQLSHVPMSSLEAWIPLGYHLYVISLQRSKILGRLRQAIHQHLGACVGPAAEGGKGELALNLGDSAIRCIQLDSGSPPSVAAGPDVWCVATPPGGSAKFEICGTSEMGDSAHGKSALVLFARTSDVESGVSTALSGAREGTRHWGIPRLGEVRDGTRDAAYLQNVETVQKPNWNPVMPQPYP